MDGDAFETFELPVSPISLDELDQVLASRDPDDLDPEVYLGTIKNLIWFLRRYRRTLAGRLDATLSPDWQPTADNINALPEPVRRYIHDLETRIRVDLECGVAGDTGNTRRGRIRRPT